MKTTVINIYGAPGAGKSTLAAELYAELSKRGESVELVREVAKEMAWKGIKPTVFEQIHITTEQMLRETSLYGKVKYIVTDSPIALGDFYNWYYNKNLALSDIWLSSIDKASEGLIEKKINIFLSIKPENYKNEGRYSSLEESLKIEQDLKHYLQDIRVKTIESTELFKELNNAS